MDVAVWGNVPCVSKIDTLDFSTVYSKRISELSRDYFSVCVFITAGPITKLFAGGGGGEWTTCAMIDDEPRPVWISKP